MTIKWLQMAENPKNIHQNVRNLHFFIEATLQPPGQVLGTVWPNVCPWYHANQSLEWAEIFRKVASHKYKSID